VTYFKVQSRNFRGVSEEDHEKPRLRKSASRSRLEILSFLQIRRS